jgi:ATP synthase protein I
VLLLGAIGYLLDRWLGTAPWFLLGGLVAGLAIGFYGLVRSARPSQSSVERARSEGKVDAL